MVVSASYCDSKERYKPIVWLVNSYIATEVNAILSLFALFGVVDHGYFFMLRPNQFISIFFFIFMLTLFIRAIKLLILLFAYFLFS